jgi:prepilin-type processing-associated H-X9-DG protein
VHDYEMAHEHFPSGTLNPEGPIKSIPKGHHISWIAHILPHIEEYAVYNNLDLSLSAYHSKNDRARQATIAVLVCPSSSAAQWPYSNYAGCHHDVEAPIDADNRGVFYLNSKITRDDLKDGAAYTLFLGEKLSDDFDLGWLSGTSATLRNTGTPLNFPPRNWSPASPPWLHNYWVDESQWQWSNEQVDPVTGEVVPVEAPAEPGAESAADGSEKTDPKLVPDANGFLKHSRLGGNATAPLAVGGFASSHSGGVNFAMGDGSVRFIGDNASAGLMGRLANREDGQIVNASEW